MQNKQLCKLTGVERITWWKYNNEINDLKVPKIMINDEKPYATEH
jgi:hypothetical protein